MEDLELRNRLMTIVALSAEFCQSLEGAAMKEQYEFFQEMINLLPRIYWEFATLDVVEPIEQDSFVMPEYMDEDYYDSIRRGLERVTGPDDMFLETFEEDMKYSDTPIAVSIAESLADIFQPLYNFISHVRETESDQLQEAFVECQENFKIYWSQTLCNVLRAINNLVFRSSLG